MDVTSVVGAVVALSVVAIVDTTSVSVSVVVTAKRMPQLRIKILF